MSFERWRRSPAGSAGLGSVWAASALEPGVGGEVSRVEALTEGLRVIVEARYAPEHSQPMNNQWFFLYTVRISNEGGETCQLVSRHWVIRDATGRVEEVEGAGVVGEQPVLEPGEAFEYTSGCPLPTPYGSMQGSYQMVTESGAEFDAEIPRFELACPRAVH